MKGNCYEVKFRATSFVYIGLELNNQHEKEDSMKPINYRLDASWLQVVIKSFSGS